MSPGLPWRLYAPDIRLPDKPASYLDYAVRLSKTRRALPVTVRPICPAPRPVIFALTPIWPLTACPSRPRSEERRVGKECVSPCRSRGSPDDEKKKKKKQN